MLGKLKGYPVPHCASQQPLIPVDVHLVSCRKTNLITNRTTAHTLTFHNQCKTITPKAMQASKHARFLAFRTPPGCHGRADEEMEMSGWVTKFREDHSYKQ